MFDVIPYDVACWLLVPADLLLKESSTSVYLRAVDLILGLIVMQYFVIAAVYTRTAVCVFAMILNFNRQFEI